MGRGDEAAEAFARAAELDPALQREAVDTTDSAEGTVQDPRLVDGSDPIAFASVIMDLVKRAHRAEGRVEAAVYFPGLKSEVYMPHLSPPNSILLTICPFPMPLYITATRVLLLHC